MVDKIIIEANKWIGYLEKKDNSQLESLTGNAGYQNYTIFAKKYKEYFGVNYQGQPWCAIFVSYIFRQALGSTVQQNIMPCFSYCPYGVNQFKQMGCWVKSNPKIGDIIFFQDSAKIACHVGIVYKVDKQYVYTIEGNTSSEVGVVANGGAVAKKKYLLNYNKILGYGRPKYTIVSNKDWQEEFLMKLINQGYIADKVYWQQYDQPITYATCVALLDKVTGGTWTSIESNSQIHWAQPHVISLCGKKAIENPNDWINNLDNYINKALLVAIIDKATNGILNKYKNQQNSHWAIKHINSLCDKKIIDTPTVWVNEIEAQVNRGNYMALICKAFL